MRRRIGRSRKGRRKGQTEQLEGEIKMEEEQRRKGKRIERVEVEEAGWDLRKRRRSTPN